MCTTHTTGDPLVTNVHKRCKTPDMKAPEDSSTWDAGLSTLVSRTHQQIHKSRVRWYKLMHSAVVNIR